MATTTPKLGLVKPEMSDYADIRVLNGNMDILDKEVGGLNYVKDVTKSDEGLTFTKKDDTEISVPLDYMKISGGNFKGDISIKNNAVDYIIERVEQGRSFYEKYNSGKLVQVIYLSRPNILTGIDKDTINFLTPFIDMSYLVWVSYEINVTNRYGWQNSALNPTTAGEGSNGNTELRWGDRSTTALTVTADVQTDILVYCIGRWK